MKCFRTLVGLTIATAVCWLASAARADVLTSPDAFSPGNSVMTFEGIGSFNIPGVQFLDNFNGTTGFGGDGGTSNDLLGSGNYANLFSSTDHFSDLAITFSSPQSAVGAFAGKVRNFLNKNASSLQVSVFDASNNLLDSTTLVLNPEIGGKPISFVGFNESAGISRIEWAGGDTGFFGIDNVGTFAAGNADVPVGSLA